MSRPFPPRSSHREPQLKVNGKIRAREVRVIGIDGQQVGILALGEAISLARSHGVDLVEIAPTATPPVCRVVDFGKFRYEQSKKEKESKKHQHANKVKELQLTATIDDHDFMIKAGHAIDFLCEDMKVKASLRFRGREMAHQEFGYKVVQRFVAALAPYGHPDAAPKLVGRTINVIFTPLPRNKRAKHPKDLGPGDLKTAAPPSTLSTSLAEPLSPPSNLGPGGFNNNPFGNLDGRMGSN